MNRFSPLLLALGLSACPCFSNPLSSTFTDSIPPAITCPPSVTLAISGTGCDTVYNYSVTAEDDQPGVILAKVSGISSGQPFPIGLTVNLYLAVDAAGNTASCSFSVQVDPPPASGFSCKDTAVLALDNACTRKMAGEDALLAPFPCPAGFILEVDRVAPFGNGPWEPAEFTASDLGKTYSMRAKHRISGNSCWGRVKLVDSLPPVLSCPQIEISCAVPTAHLEPGFLQDSLGIAAGRPLVSENCPGANLTETFADQLFNLPCDSPGNVTGYIRRTWTVLDASGNLGSCVQTINRIRSVDNVVYPPDLAVSCADPNTAIQFTGGPSAPAGSRLYSLLTAPFCEIDAFYDDSIELLCGGSYRIHRSWTVRDACRPIGPGNPVSGVQRIDVLDLDGPVFQCPGDTVLLVPTDSCVAAVDLPDLIVSDFCSTVETVTAFWTVDGLTHNLVGTLGDFSGNDPASSDTLAVLGSVPDFPVGLISLLYIATDTCGNEASCEIALQVWDGQPPLVVCDSFLTILLDTAGQAVLPAGLPAAGSSDACTPLAFKIRRNQGSACGPAVPQFEDQLAFCCAEAGDTLPVSVRVYDLPLPPGAVADTFATGQFSTCALNVLVVDTLGLVCTAPADVSVDCDDFDPDLTAYGFPAISCRADSLAEWRDYTQFDSACSRGTIARVFQVFDKAGGQSGSCVQQIELSSTQDYFIRFPDDVIATTCDPDGSYGSPTFFGTNCEDMVAAFTDEIFDIVPDACYKIERSWTITNACTYDTAVALTDVPNPNPNTVVNHPSNLSGPVVSAPGTTGPWAPSLVKITPTEQATDYSMFWAADANGYRYKQIIKIIDVQKPLFSNCTNGTVTIPDSTTNDPQFWHESYWYNLNTGTADLCEGPVDLCVTATDLCAGADVQVRYLLFLDLDNDGQQETVVSSTKLPGYNNVQFGNAMNPNYTGGQSRSFDERPVPANQKYGFTLQTITQGNQKTACVRWNTLQNPLAYTIPQLPQGEHRIKWIVADKCGNETICEQNISITDQSGACGIPQITVSGQIRTENGAGIADVDVQVDVTPLSQTPYTLHKPTDSLGIYSFPVGAKDAYVLTPRRNDNPLNGVSTFDLLLINKHVLGLQPLSSPYRIIAADANGSRSVSTFDIIELRKLILGIYTELPSSPSWRFIDADYVFPNIANPFQTVFPEIKTAFAPHPTDPVHHFTGVKIGDVDGNAAVNKPDAGPQDRTSETLFLDLADRAFQAGEILDVPLAVAEPVAGFQFGLAFPGLELLRINPGPGMRTEHFAVFPDESLLTASWAEGGQANWQLRFRAKHSGRLSDLLQLSSVKTRPEAYRDSDGGQYELLRLALRFDGQTVKQQGIELFQNQPNPFSGSTVLGFYLPEAETATLRVVDGVGRVWFSRTSNFSAGLHSLTLEKEFSGAGPGVYFYSLETSGVRLMRRMVLLR